MNWSGPTGCASTTTCGHGGCFHAIESLDPQLLRLWDTLHCAGAGPAVFSQGRAYARMSALSYGGKFEVFCVRDASGHAPAVLPLRRGEIDLGVSFANRRIATLWLQGLTV